MSGTDERSQTVCGNSFEHSHIKKRKKNKFPIPVRLEHKVSIILRLILQAGYACALFGLGPPRHPGKSQSELDWSSTQSGSLTSSHTNSDFIRSSIVVIRTCLPHPVYFIGFYLNLWAFPRAIGPLRVRSPFTWSELIIPYRHSSTCIPPTVLIATSGPPMSPRVRPAISLIGLFPSFVGNVQTSQVSEKLLSSIIFLERFQRRPHESPRYSVNRTECNTSGNVLFSKLFVLFLPFRRLLDATPPSPGLQT